jgi:hypothetical protein
VDQVKKELGKYKKPLPGEPYHVAANTGGASTRRRSTTTTVRQRQGDRGGGDNDDAPPERSDGPPPLLRDFYTETSLATELGITIRTLRRWRKERRGPPITHVGRKVVYSTEGLRRWLAANEQQMPRGARRPRAASSEAEIAA